MWRSARNELVRFIQMNPMTTTDGVNATMLVGSPPLQVTPIIAANTVVTTNAATSRRWFPEALRATWELALVACLNLCIAQCRRHSSGLGSAAGCFVLACAPAGAGRVDIGFWGILGAGGVMITFFMEWVFSMPGYYGYIGPVK